MAAPKHEVTCPDCGHRQHEVEGAISTICRECGHSFQLTKPEPRRRQAAMPGHERTLTCRHCAHRNHIPADALSTLCENCGAYLDLGTHRIDGPSIEKLDTYGDVHFTPGCRYTGGRVRAGTVTVDGRVRADHLQAETVLVRAGGELIGHVVAGEVEIARKGTLKGSVEAARLRVEGRLEAQRAEITGTVDVEGGEMRVGHLRTAALEVTEGSRFDGEVELIE